MHMPRDILSQLVTQLRFTSYSLSNVIRRRQTSLYEKNEFLSYEKTLNRYIKIQAVNYRPHTQLKKVRKYKSRLSLIPRQKKNKTLSMM